MLNAVVHQTLNNSQAKQRAKKKSVSFCDQVILVATANNQEDDDFIPNPILERVLRTANYNGEDEIGQSKAAVLLSQQQQQNVMRLQTEPALRHGISQINNTAISSAQQKTNQIMNDIHRQNMEIQKQMIDNRYGGTGVSQQNGYSPATVTDSSMASRPQLNYVQDISRLQNVPETTTTTTTQQRQAAITNVGAGNQHLQMNNSQDIGPSYVGVQQQQQQQLEQQRQRLMMNGINGDLPRVQYDMDTQQPLSQSPYMHVPQTNGNYNMQNRIGYPNATAMNQQSYNIMNGGRQMIQPQSVYQKPPTNMFIHQQQQTQPQQTNGQSYQNGYVQDNQMINKMAQSQPLQNMSAYQRVPMPMSYGMSGDINGMTQQQYFQPPQPQQPQTQQQQQQLQQPPQNKGAATKKVSFEPGTKGGPDCLINGGALPNPNGIDTIPMHPVLTTAQNVTAIPTRVFNNNAIVKASAKAVQCNLCRKKHVIAPAIYCSDCDFYMSRFQPTRR